MQGDALSPVLFFPGVPVFLHGFLHHLQPGDAVSSNVISHLTWLPLISTLWGVVGGATSTDLNLAFSVYITWSFSHFHL